MAVTSVAVMTGYRTEPEGPERAGRTEWVDVCRRRCGGSQNVVTVGACRNPAAISWWRAGTVFGPTRT